MAISFSSSSGSSQTCKNIRSFIERWYRLILQLVEVDIVGPPTILSYDVYIRPMHWEAWRTVEVISQIILDSREFRY